MENERKANLAIGRNQVKEALKASLADKVFVARGGHGSAVDEIRRIAAAQHVPVVDVPRRKIEDMCEGLRSQGIVAHISEVPHADIDDIITAARHKGEDPLIILLDQIQDPHNLGAIIRSADAAGVHGVILTTRRTAGVTETVFRTSAGAAAYVPVARVPSLSDAIEKLKAAGVWIAGAEQTGGESLFETNLSGPLGVVIGGEEKGLRPLIRKICDFTVRIPMCGKVNSLNASVAAGIILYEIRRTRDQKQ